MHDPASTNPVDPALSAHASLQAPWRMQYLMNIADDDRARAGGHEQAVATGGMTSPAPSSGSFIRDYWLAPHLDTANHVIVRTHLGMVFLNAFPYSNGHLLVALGDARGRLLDYDPEQRAALWRLTDLATDLTELTLQPQGVNIGVNQGRAAGAGVPQHLHVHVIPRWGGDTNFITTVGRVRVIPASLEVMAQRYRAAWATLSPKWVES
jgi:ATP adenylyltransferase